MTEELKAAIKEQLFGTVDGSKEDAEKNDSLALGVLGRIERNFGTEQAIVDNYVELEKGSLFATNLNFGRRFFEVLRELQLYGWRTDNDGPLNQEAKLTEIGAIIGQELFRKQWPKYLPRVLQPPPEPAQSERPKTAIAATNAPRSKRVFEVMGVYDGTNKRFMREWPAEPTRDVKFFDTALSAASGAVLGSLSEDVHIGRKIGKEQDEFERIRPWSPEDHKHNISTLILAGTADPATAGEQPKSFLGKYRVGDDSLLLEFEGVGHELIIPAVDISSEAVSSKLRGINANTLNCLVDAFINKPFEVFHDAAKKIAARLLTEEGMRVGIREEGLG
jgi:hypothetical protein